MRNGFFSMRNIRPQSKSLRLGELTLALLATLVLAPVAWAACTSPSGVDGDLRWFTGESTYKYCIEDSWVAVNETGTLGSCSAPGDFGYDTGENAFRQCDGANWQKVGCIDAGGGGGGLPLCQPTGAPPIYITGSDTISGDNFGMYGLNHSPDGTYLAAGAFADDNNRGSVYLFDASTLNEIRKLTASDGGVFDAFGSSVKFNSDETLLLILSAYDGSAYIFDVATGAQIRKLVPNDSVSLLFSIAFSPDSNYVLIGGGEAAYLFDSSTGNQLRKFTASDGEDGDNFGYSVSFNTSGTKIIIGAIGDSSNQGSAYLFDVATGTEIYKFTPDSGDTNFGIITFFDEDGSHLLIGNQSLELYYYDSSTGSFIEKFGTSEPEWAEYFQYQYTGNSFHTIADSYIPSGLLGSLSVKAEQRAVYAGDDEVEITDLDCDSSSSCFSLGSCSDAGMMEYDTTNKMVAYCDGQDWHLLAY